MADEASDRPRVEREIERMQERAAAGRKHDLFERQAALPAPRKGGLPNSARRRDRGGFDAHDAAHRSDRARPCAVIDPLAAVELDRAGRRDGNSGRRADDEHRLAGGFQRGQEAPVETRP